MVYASALIPAWRWSILVQCRFRRSLLPAVYHLPFDDLKDRSLKIRGLEARDFDDAFEKIRSPTTADEIDRYEECNRNFGE
ncbi:hypothetical protein [Methanoculleus receptaculi]|uniref:Uncharacterized protein n=1 Tax=Methanoculleus receptaculi TaxID=394967 RepID=A0AAX4FTX8_9EURY|nr:hypothetical protein [Methanoculleus receptaculi]WOX57386.1 hypothetical protein R6Y96_08800 [Methanoculleus receptaculi]